MNEQAIYDLREKFLKTIKEFETDMRILRAARIESFLKSGKLDIHDKIEVIQALEEVERAMRNDVTDFYTVCSLQP